MPLLQVLNGTVSQHTFHMDYRLLIVGTIVFLSGYLENCNYDAKNVILCFLGEKKVIIFEEAGFKGMMNYK